MEISYFRYYRWSFSILGTTFFTIVLEKPTNPEQSVDFGTI